jgi:superfamily II DNA or RNA helicase
MQLTAHEAAVRDLVGADLFARALPYARGGAVLDLEVGPFGESAKGLVRGTARQPYRCRVILNTLSDGTMIDFLGSCSCPVGDDCKHSVALLLVAMAPPEIERQRFDDHAPLWQHALSGLLRQPEPDAGDCWDADETRAPVALQFELTGRGPDLVVNLRPVLPGANGNWVRTGISWTNLYSVRHGRSRRAAASSRLLNELLSLYEASQREYLSYYAGRPGTIQLSAFTSRRLWDLLAEARAGGMPFVLSRKTDGPVVLHDEPVQAALDVRSSTDGLHLTPRLRHHGTDLATTSAYVLGSPPHGLAWIVGEADRPGRELHLARLDVADGVDIRALLSTPTVRVPAADADLFRTDYLPALGDSIPVVSSDGSVQVPSAGSPTLVLHLTHSAGRAALRWSWRYPSGAFELGPADERPGRLRDAAAERDLRARALAICERLPALTHRAELAPSAVLTGPDLITFATEVRPALSTLVGVVIESDGTEPDFREATETPEIEFSATAARGGPDRRDWLDLDVTVRIDGQTVAFPDLFRALAAGERVLVLSSGTWFSLNRPEFAQLADLIAESRRLHDGEPGKVRVGKYQASMWADLELLGTIRGQVAEWHTAVRGLLNGAADTPPPLPDGLDAELRPYQQVGFGWLAHLYEHGLGGVLADEMGLGKTVQCLALFCHARERDPGAAPFLVVAPTSVVSNWAAEAQRFAPGLKVVAITETGRRRGAELAEVVDGADLVITSYALFRIDYAAYASLPWAGLVLDEAQFAKNHRAKAFECATTLAAPFKLAITGTPLENNLMELWSMFAITAPGLFPDPRAFEEYYRSRIERGHNPELLAQLRRRIRPFLLRRTKAEVVKDLPAKQEQVLELDLNAKHRTAYQRYLQRERRKILGLLGDFDRNQFEILRSLTLLRQAALDVSLVDEAHAGSVPSTKLDELLDMLGEIVAEGHRVVVFSQFTRFLDRVRKRLAAAGIEHSYLDGRTRNRATVINGFKSGAAPVFLISLKAGGFGLNLTEADYCILLDPWWNPATEAQAVDRIHRIGQTNPVTVYRLVARDTIEQKVMALKAGKAELFASVMDGGDWQGGRLSADEIRDLLS